jgi:hypothetical protein
MPFSGQPPALRREEVAPLLSSEQPRAMAHHRTRGVYRERSPWPGCERLVIVDRAGGCVVDATIRASAVTPRMMELALLFLDDVDQDAMVQAIALRAVGRARDGDADAAVSVPAAPPPSITLFLMK